MPGAQLVACDSPVGRLGVTVCYDLRFPAVYQELVYAQGAEVLLVPSAFTVRTGGDLCPYSECQRRAFLQKCLGERAETLHCAFCWRCQPPSSGP